MTTWLSTHYPATIVKDRYCGTYYGGEWFAFPLFPSDVPKEIFACDIIACDYLCYYQEPFGIGGTPDEALENLINSINNHVQEGM